MRPVKRALKMLENPEENTSEKDQVTQTKQVKKDFHLTAPFNNMRTDHADLNRQMRFLLPSIKCSAAPPSFRLLPSAR